VEVKIKNFKFTWPGQTKPLLVIPDWTVEKESHVLLWGDSGKGKTTLLHCIGGLLSATEGDIQIHDFSYRTMKNNDRDRLRRSMITMVFQRLNLIKHLTTLENVLLGVEGKPGVAKAGARSALERLGMLDAADRLAWKLSAGEQQRTALARALVRQTPLTLADEPTANLDKTNAVHVIKELFRSTKEHKHTLVVVSHDERIRPLFDVAYNIEEITTS
jgi:putative ABC transport system ATP-binding protein